MEGIAHCICKLQNAKCLGFAGMERRGNQYPLDDGELPMEERKEAVLSVLRENDAIKDFASNEEL